MSYHRFRLALAYLAAAWSVVSCNRSERSTADQRVDSAAPPAGSLETIPAGWFGTAAHAPAGGSIRRTYKIALTSSLSARASDDAASESAGSRLGLSGRWALTLLPGRGDTAVVLAQLDLDRLEIGKPVSEAIEAKEYEARIKGDLQLPILLKLDRHGRVIAIKSIRRMSAHALSVVRAAAAFAQISEKPGTASDWIAEEQDTAGTYRVRYHHVDERRFAKQKLDYREVDTGQGLRSPEPGEFRIEISDASYTLSVDGGLEALSLTEQVAIEPRDQLPAMRARSEWRLKLVDSEVGPTPTSGLERLTPFEWRSLHQQPPEEAHELELDITKVGRFTRVQDILDQLDRVPASATDQRSRLYIALGALIRLNTAALRDAIRLARPGGHDEVLLRALARSGVPEAERAVLQAVEDPARLPPRARAEVLVAVSVARNPTKVMVDGFERLLADPLLREQALLGLGSMCFRLKDDDPPLARRVLALLDAQLTAATEAGSFKAAKQALEAFGNAGHPAALAMLQPYLTAHQGPVRAAAAGALRRIPGDDIDGFLHRLLEREADSDVRQAVRRVFEERQRRSDFTRKYL